MTNSCNVIQSESMPPRQNEQIIRLLAVAASEVSRL